MDGLRLLKLRRRQPTAPAFGAARGPRFVHATTAGTDAGYGARDWLADCRALKRRRAAVDAAAPGQVYEYYMFLWAIFYASYLCLPFAR